MKYMYTICLVLSSFFIYKPLNADTNIQQNAFFIPGGAFQQNIQNSAQQTNPRRRQNNNTSAQETSPTQAEHPLTQKQDIANTSTPPIISEKQPAPIAKTTPTAAVTTAQTVSTNVSKETAPLKKTKQNITKKTSKEKKQYTLEKTITNALPQKDAEKNTQLSSLEQFQQKSLQEMLNTLPYPDFNLPKYKQIYALYALELRSAHRRGKLPANYEQEETLAKANSIRRFDVK